MRIKKISRRLRYLFLNPKYSALYFLGKPEKIINALTGEPVSRFFELKENLDSDSNFVAELRERTSTFANEHFKLTIDHYFLYTLVRLTRPRLILETGVFDGYFTVCFLKALYDNFSNEGIEGKLVSIDLPSYEIMMESTSEMARTHLPPGCEPGWVIPENLKERWQLHLGDSRELLPRVAREVGDISLFFHDSLHTYSHMMFEYETVWPLLEKGAFLMSHDIYWNRAFRDFVKRHQQVEFVTRSFGIIKKRQNLRINLKGLHLRTCLHKG